MPNDPQLVQQYRTTSSVGGYCLREDRGLIEVTGRDRTAWLNNLVTNVILTLRPGEGNYAFACNVKGRIVFDLNMLVLEDRLWLDVDRRQVAAALAHLDRYLITEDVKLTDFTSKTPRVAVMGPRAGQAVAQLDLGDLSSMSPLQHVARTLAGVPVRVVRHDFAGLPTAEFIVPDAAAPTGPQAAIGAVVSACAAMGFARLERPTIEVLRIEAGIPAFVDDINEEILPPETGQIERGISYTKGCYLGQEVVERMRSRGSLARRLVGLRVAGDEPVPPRSAVTADGAEVGHTRSSCWSEAAGAILALAYVKTSCCTPGTSIAVVAPASLRTGQVIQLPARPAASFRRPLRSATACHVHPQALNLLGLEDPWMRLDGRAIRRERSSVGRATAF